MGLPIRLSNALCCNRDELNGALKGYEIKRRVIRLKVPAGFSAAYPDWSGLSFLTKTVRRSVAVPLQLIEEIHRVACWPIYQRSLPHQRTRDVR